MQLLWDSFHFVIQPHAYMGGFSFEDQLGGLVRNAISKGEPHPFEEVNPNLDCQQIIISRRSPIAEPAFDYGENDALLLPFKKCGAQCPEEFAASGLQQVRVATIVYMVAERALSVSDSMRMAEHGYAQSFSLDALQPFDRGLHSLEGVQHLDAGFLGRRILRVAPESVHFLEDLRCAFLQAGHVLFPGELLVGARQKIGQVSNVFASGSASLMLPVY